MTPTEKSASEDTFFAMRPYPVILALSLLANLGLAIVHFRQPASPTSVSSASESPPPATTSSSASAAKREFAQLPALVSRLQTGDLATGLDELRRLGLPEDTIKTLAEGAIMRRFREGMAALNRGGSFNYWQGGYAQNKEQREKQQQMMQLMRDLGEQARLAGITWNMFSQYTDEGILTEDKALLVTRIKQDHDEMRSQIHLEAQGLMLERDQEKLRFLNEEYQKDLAAALTPQELEEWNLRNSNTARQLKSQLAHMQPTEDEFRQIHRLQSVFDETWSYENRGGNIDWQKRSEAEKAMKAEIAALLGAKRNADYVKSTDREFGTLSNLEYRLELPAGTADRLYAMHAESDTAAKTIREDKQLSKDDQKAALKALADKVTADMTTALGEEGFNAYRNQGGHWIEQLRR
ncbi:MAG: hypothetical protein ABII82_05185 [Verrucomicrobiota bacterium]